MLEADTMWNPEEKTASLVSCFLLILGAQRSGPHIGRPRRGSASVEAMSRWTIDVCTDLGADNLSTMVMVPEKALSASPREPDRMRCGKCNRRLRAPVTVEASKGEV